MTRVENILLRARDTLADTKKERWSDERLLRLVDEGQLDICMRAKLLRETYSTPVIDGKAEYKLPDDLLYLDRVLYNGSRIEMVGHTQLDREKGSWEKDKGEPYYVVFDKQNRGHLRLYPIPHIAKPYEEGEKPSFNENTSFGLNTSKGVCVRGSSTDKFSSPYGIVTHMWWLVPDRATNADRVSVRRVPFFQFQKYGCVTKIMYGDLNTLKPKGVGAIQWIEGYKSRGSKGIVTQVIDGDKTIKSSSPYGMVTGIARSNAKLEINYLRRPAPIISINSELNIDDIFDKALKFYVTSAALKDDMDTQNLQVANTEFSYYERELNIAIGDDMKDFTRNNSKQFNTPYYTPFI